MDQTVENEIKNYGEGVCLLLVEDDELTADLYSEYLRPYVRSVETAANGKEALEKFTRSKDRYDLVVTDIMMPLMDGFDLIKKLREHSSQQRIIVMTALDDLNEMQEIINLGVDGILKKPFHRERFFDVAYRVFKNIYQEKLLKTRLQQLLLLAKEKMELKSDIKREQPKPQERTPKIEKHVPVAPSKADVQSRYKIRETLQGGSSDDFLDQLDHFADLKVDKIDMLQDRLIEHEVLLCKLSHISDPKRVLESFREVAEGLKEFVNAINSFGKFAVASNAASQLIVFLQELELEKLQDAEKKELMIDGMILLLQDINDWLVTVFVHRSAPNINYFDASFANSCMEIEMIFAEQEQLPEDEDDALEFF